MTNDQAEDSLKLMIDDRFLGILAYAAQVDGNGGDFPAIKDFVNWCFAVVEKQPPNLTPYELDD